MSGLELSRWSLEFINYFKSVTSFFFNTVFRSLADILLDSRIIMFTAVFVACSAISAVCYIVINSRSDSFDDVYVNDFMSVPKMTSKIPLRISFFLYRVHSLFRRRKSKLFFETNSRFIMFRHNGLTFFAPNLGRRNWSKSVGLRRTTFRDKFGRKKVR